MIHFDQQWLEKNEFKENTSTIDLKIVLYLVAIGLAYWSHFVIKFPQEAHLLYVALGVYGLICIIHYYLENYVEK